MSDQIRDEKPESRAKEPAGGVVVVAVTESGGDGDGEAGATTATETKGGREANGNPATTTGAGREKDGGNDDDADDGNEEKPPPPRRWRLMAVVLITLIRFGGAWSNGITGAMKSTIKRELRIDNRQYALLEASEDFMATVLMVGVGLLTDRLGGAGALVAGNGVYALGSVVVAAAAQVRSYRVMVGGRVVLALGDIATQVAQYQVFSAWFAPGRGFAATLGLELMVQKLGALAGTGSANAIARGTGDFAWVYWIAVFVNVFTIAASWSYRAFARASAGKFGSVVDPASGERLRHKAKRLDVAKVARMPWPFWCILLFSLFATSTSVVFRQNATELAEQRFKISAVTAGWYAALTQYAGFFIVPLVAVFIDFYGQRITLLVICGIGTFLSMALVQWAGAVTGTAAAFGIFAVVSSYSPTVIIDGIRTSLLHQTDFGTAYALKIIMNNSINIIVRLLAGALQDADRNAYDRVVVLYLVLAGGSLAVALALAALALAPRAVDLGMLQWSRRRRTRDAAVLAARRARLSRAQDDDADGANAGSDDDDVIAAAAVVRRNRIRSRVGLALLGLLLLGGWAAYIWGAVTGAR